MKLRKVFMMKTLRNIEVRVVC